jgi:hypothetical protein
VLDKQRHHVGPPSDDGPLQGGVTGLIAHVDGHVAVAQKEAQRVQIAMCHGQVDEGLASVGGVQARGADAALGARTGGRCPSGGRGNGIGKNMSHRRRG